MSIKSDGKKESGKKVGRLRKLIIVIAVVVALLAAGGVAGYLPFYLKGKNLENTASKVTIKDINLSSVADGEYKGRYSIDDISANVIVFVSGNNIIDIVFENGTGHFAKNKENYIEMRDCLINAVLERQSLEVDTISGATASSKALLKAVEEALSGNAE